MLCIWGLELDSRRGAKYVMLLKHAGSTLDEGRNQRAAKVLLHCECRPEIFHYQIRNGVATVSSIDVMKWDAQPLLTTFFSD